MIWDGYTSKMGNLEKINVDKRAFVMTSETDFKKKKYAFIIVFSIGLLVSYSMKDKFLFAMNIFALEWIVISYLDFKYNISKRLRLL